MVGEVVQPGRGMKSVPWFCGILSAKPKEHLLLGGFKYFLSSPLPGEMIQFDEHISQMGRNHQPDWIYPSPRQIPVNRISYCIRKVREISLKLLLGGV